MTREIDRRNFSIDRNTQDRMDQLKEKALDISERLPNEHKIEIEKFDGKLQ